MKKLLTALTLCFITFYAEAESRTTNADVALANSGHPVRCYQILDANTATCIDAITKAPCTMIFGTTKSIYEMGNKAKLVRGFVYLNGSFQELGPYPAEDYTVITIHSNDGQKWESGVCYFSWEKD